MASSVFARNLKVLILEQQISEAELSRRTGIAQPIINGFTRGKGKNPTLDSLKKIADYFVISVSQLIGEEPLPKKRLKGKKSSSSYGKAQIPVISWSEAGGDLKKVDIFEKEFITLDSTSAKGIFALKMTGSSMEPIFPENTILIFDTNKEPVDGDYCLLQLSDRKAPAFKQLFEDAGAHFCRSINPSFDDFKALTSKDKVLAVLLQARHCFKEK